MLGKFSPKGLEAVASFWEYVGFVANSLNFLLIGVNLVAHHVFTVVSGACLTIILLILRRALAAYGCCGAFVKAKQCVHLFQQHLLVWGGLHGALALALGLPAALPERDNAISVTFAVVAFSILFQGLTMTPLLRYFGELGQRGELNLAARR